MLPDSLMTLKFAWKAKSAFLLVYGIEVCDSADNTKRRFRAMRVKASRKRENTRNTLEHLDNCFNLNVRLMGMKCYLKFEFWFYRLLNFILSSNTKWPYQEMKYLL